MTTASHSATLQMTYNDLDNDGDIDSLTRPSDKDLPKSKAQPEISLKNLSPMITSQYFSNDIFGTSITSDNLRLVGVQIQPLENYLTAIKQANEAKQREHYEIEERRIIAEETPEDYANYVVNYFTPEMLDASLSSDQYLVKAALYAFEAELDTNLIHDDVKKSTRSIAQDYLDMSHTVKSKKDQNQLVDYAFDLMYQIGESTLTGHSQEEWTSIHHLDRQTAKTSSKNLSSASTYLAKDNGLSWYINPKPNKENTPPRLHTPSGPHSYITDFTIEYVESYLNDIEQSDISNNEKTEIKAQLAKDVTSWFEKQINTATNYRDSHSRVTSTVFWQQLNQTYSELPTELSTPVAEAYESNTGITLMNDIKAGWALDLENSRDHKIFIAQDLSSFHWIATAIEEDLEIRELGHQPQTKINWSDVISKLEAKSKSQAPTALASQVNQLNSNTVEF